MKTGRSLGQLMTELERQQDSKKDYKVPRGLLTVIPNERSVNDEIVGDLRLAMGDSAPGVMTQGAHRQLGELLKVPAVFYERMREAHPKELANTLNVLLRDDPRANRLVRCLDGGVRALLSDRYRPLENFDLAQAVLPVLKAQGVEVASCEVTERRLYIKALVPGTTAEIPPPGVTDWEWGKEHHSIDVVTPGVEIGNSETGFGSLYVKPGVHTRRCSNLAVFQRDCMRKTHLGKQLTDSDLNMSERTRRLQDATVWSQLEDVVKAAIDGSLFDSYVQELRVARGQLIEGNQELMIEEVTGRLGLTKEEGSQVLNKYIDGADRTRYGVAAAITAAAQDAPSYDRSTELERMGGQVIELPRNDWQQILDKAA